MKVKILSAETVAELEDSWALRLIEQGKAVPVPARKPGKKEEHGTD